MLKIEKELVKFIASLPLVKVKSVQLEHPSNPDFGDYSTNIALKLFPTFSKRNLDQYKIESPRELAHTIVSQLQDNLEQFSNLSAYIRKIEVAGPGFINFYFSPDFFIDSLKLTLSSSNYGHCDSGKGLTWGLEHTSPNPNKSMHLGHLRNNLVGMALGRLWEAVGINVVFEEMDNNRGIAIAKLMWGFLKFAKKNQNTPTAVEYWSNYPEEWYSPEDLNTRPDRFVDGLYIKGSQDFESDPKIETLVRQMVIDWENEDSDIWKLWKHVLDFSYKGQQLTLNRLDNRWDKIWHESDHYKQGKDYIDLGIKKGVFKILEDGAVLTNLEKYGLPDTVVKKADGTALYITQDIALTSLKIKELKADRLHWVVGPEQKLAFEQLFAVCDQLRIADLDKLEHLTYGYMSIKGQGKMSSRSGNVLYIDDLIDLAKQKASKLIKADCFAADQLETLAESVGVGAIKYAILKVARISDMAFDVDSALKLDGNSGPYLQYAHARAKSVLRKSGLSMQKIQELLIDDKSSVTNKMLVNAFSLIDTKGLISFLYQFPEIVEQSAFSKEPSILANYLFDLAQSYNSFYNHQQFLVDDEPIRTLCLGISSAVAKVLNSGLALLGIQAPEQM